MDCNQYPTSLFYFIIGIRGTVCCRMLTLGFSFCHFFLFEKLSQAFHFLAVLDYLLQYSILFFPLACANLFLHSASVTTFNDLDFSDQFYIFLPSWGGGVWGRTQFEDGHCMHAISQTELWIMLQLLFHVSKAVICNFCCILPILENVLGFAFCIQNMRNKTICSDGLGGRHKSLFSFHINILCSELRFDS